MTIDKTRTTTNTEMTSVHIADRPYDDINAVLLQFSVACVGNLIYDCSTDMLIVIVI